MSDQQHATCSHLHATWAFIYDGEIFAWHYRAMSHLKSRSHAILRYDLSLFGKHSVVCRQCSLFFNHFFFARQTKSKKTQHNKQTGIKAATAEAWEKKTLSQRSWHSVLDVGSLADCKQSSMHIPPTRWVLCCRQHSALLSSKNETNIVITINSTQWFRNEKLN